MSSKKLNNIINKEALEAKVDKRGSAKAVIAGASPAWSSMRD